MLTNKNILLICKEKSSFAMYHLGKELEKKNKVSYFFIYNPEVLNKTINYRQTFFYFKEKIDTNNIYDVNDLNIKFLKNRKNIKIDYNRLKTIEKNTLILIVLINNYYPLSQPLHLIIPVGILTLRHMKKIFIGFY